MCCQTCQLLGDSCSYLIHINQQYRTESTHAGVKQCPLRENHSLHSFYGVRSLKSVSSAMLKAEKAGVFPTPQTFCKEDSLLPDAGPPISRMPPRKAKIKLGSSISQCWAESLNLSLQMRLARMFFEHLRSPKNHWLTANGV